MPKQAYQPLFISFLNHVTPPFSLVVMGDHIEYTQRDTAILFECQRGGGQFDHIQIA
jgi:hypothetical protein